MATPFIDSLSAEERAFVTRLSRGEKRPLYFDASIAEAATVSGDQETTGNVQISQDLEAALILMPADAKKQLRDFVQEAITLTSNNTQDDFLLLAEVLAVRKTSYAQINADAGKKALDYDVARAKVIDDIERRARANADAGTSAAETTSVVISDLSVLFSAVSSAYEEIIRPDELAMHDRIADAGYLYTVQNAATNRARELSSWVQILPTYIAVS